MKWILMKLVRIAMDDDEDGEFNFDSSVRPLIEPLIDISQQIGLSPNFVKYISAKYQG